MELFDIPYDSLNLTIGMLRVKDQLALRATCRRAQDVTMGAALAARLASALFSPPTFTRVMFFPQCKRIPWSVWLFRNPPSTGKEVEVEAFTRIKISISGFEHSTRLKVVISMLSESLVQSGDSREGRGVWEDDAVRMRFEVTAQGDVAAVDVAFRKGFAEKRAPLVGIVLGEVLKDGDASKASLLTQAFAKCEDARPSKAMRLGPHGGVPQGSFEDGGVRVETRPQDGPEDMQAYLSLL